MTPTKPALVFTMLFATLLVVGCSPQSQMQGPQKNTEATYSRMTLRANLPAQARVPAVIAAADQTLRARGYAVVKSNSTEEQGRIVANPPQYNNFPRIIVESSRGVSSTIVTLHVEPFGDQDLCRSVLDGILQRMGL